MQFVETPIFTRRVRELLSDDDYRTLQIALMLRPEQGRLIKRSGGLRKVRWNASGTGKRGGVRVIYCRRGAEQVIYMLFAYAKTTQEDLTPNQLRALARVVRAELK